MEYAGIHLEGSILSSELLGKLRTEELPGQRPADFGFKPKAVLREEIGYAWQTAQNYWRAFQLKRERLTAADSGVSETRNIWIIPLLRELGYELQRGQAETIHEKSYAISHRDAQRAQFPVHIVGCQQSLDKKAEQGQQSRLSPHGLMQEYLNYTEHLYGIVTNGPRLRLLRDATRLSRLAYVEFDLEKIMEEERYPDFAVLYRLLHATRLPTRPEEAERCLLEGYHQLAIESGARIREKLREAVEAGMKALANGWLQHPDNHAFAQMAAEGAVDPREFYQRLLKIVYRLLFLVVIEERGLVFPPETDEEGGRQRDLYYRYYSLRRLQELALKRQFVEGRHTDLWRSVRATFALFETAGYGQQLGIAPLGGELFSEGGLRIGGTDLMALSLENKTVLEVIGGLTLFTNEQKQRVRINYTDLDVEELGSIYEALLDLNPRFYPMETGVAFGFTGGTERKETGSYYTRSDLVLQLLKSALDPVVERCLRQPTAEQQAQALLGLKVCDPAAGSGHFILAAARRIAMALARVRAGEDSPGESWYRPALREVIQRCIYGVDRNPAAIDLCRVALWLESHNPGKSLSFLEHNIRCGDSLIGLDRLERLQEGIPDEAFKARTGDDKTAASRLKKDNKTFHSARQASFFAAAQALQAQQQDFAAGYRDLLAQDDNTVADYQAKKARLEQLRNRPDWWKDWMAANLYAYAFFQPLREEAPAHLAVTSETLYNYLRNPGALHGQLAGQVMKAAETQRFFHWPLEFPEVFAQGGFDVMLGNPPWERIKLQEKEFFATRDEEIAQAANKAARERLIKAVKTERPALYRAYAQALHEAEASSNFIRASGRYPLTGQGDVNTYSIFSELMLKNTAPHGRAGFIVPTGIATDNTNKDFFGALIEQNRLVSLFDFENRKKIFPAVDSRYKFSLLTLAGASLPVGTEAQFGFFLHDVLDLDNALRVFGLTKEDFLNINPNTKTCPIFRTSVDAALTAKLYRRVPVLINEATGQNPWGVKFMRMFDMSNDSHRFRTRQQLEAEGFALMGNRFVKGAAVWLPLYEAKMIWHYDHRLSSFAQAQERNESAYFTSHADPEVLALPWYWVSESEKIEKSPSHYFIAIRDVARNTDIRTFITSVAPNAGVNHKAPLIFSESESPELLLLLGNLSSLVFDYVVRQKLGGTSMSYFYVMQMPLISESVIANEELRRKIQSNTLELTYTSWDLKSFADDVWRESDAALRAALEQQWAENAAETGGHAWAVPAWAPAYPEIAWAREAGCPLPPFKWDEGRRARLQAELDALYAKLYGLTREELRYILDPAEVYGEDFPGETFRVLKKKELKQYGEYRTQRLVLEAWDRLHWIDEAEQATRLQAAWEAYQAEGQARRAATEAPKKASASPARPKPAPAPPPPSNAPLLFSAAELAVPAGAGVRIGCQVTLEDARGTLFHYHITAHARQGAYTGTYRQLSPQSELYRLMKGLAVGARFQHGASAYTIKAISQE
jgi:hypothetical protein